MKRIFVITILITLASLGVLTAVTAQADGQWIHITEDKGIPIGIIRSMACGEDGSVWCGGDNGLFRYIDGAWEHVEDGFVSAVAIDSEGALWISRELSLKVELLKYSDAEWTTYLSQGYQESTAFIDMTATPDGGIWGANANGISRLLNGEWTVFTEEDGLPSTYMSIVAASPDGKVWCAVNKAFYEIDTEGNTGSSAIQGGVSCYDGDTWKTYTTEDGLPSNDVYAITTGNDSSVYVSTDTGIAVFDGLRWETVYQQYGGLIVMDYWGVLWSSWSSKEGDLSSYDNGAWTNHGNPSYLNFWPKACDVDITGTVWIGGEYGVYLYNKDPLNVSSSHSPPAVIEITGNYPNPFNPTTTIAFTVSRKTLVTCMIYSVSGQCIRQFRPELMRTGPGIIIWDGNDSQGKSVASGSYIAQIMTEYGWVSHLMTLLR